MANTTLTASTSRLTATGLNANCPRLSLAMWTSTGARPMRKQSPHTSHTFQALPLSAGGRAAVSSYAAATGTPCGAGVGAIIGLLLELLEGGLLAGLSAGLRAEGGGAASAPLRLPSTAVTLEGPVPLVCQRPPPGLSPALRSSHRRRRSGPGARCPLLPPPPTPWASPPASVRVEPACRAASLASRPLREMDKRPRLPPQVKCRRCCTQEVWQPCARRAFPVGLASSSESTADW